MNRLPIVLILILLLIQGCKKSTNNVVWQKSYGTGNAMFVKATADSGLLSCGELGGKPYLIKLDRNKNKISEYKYDDIGIFSSAWSDGDIAIAAGSSKKKMLITCINKQSNIVWDTTFSSGSNIDYTLLLYLGNGELLAIGSASPDSVNSGVTRLYCVWFNTEGTVSAKKEIPETPGSSSIFVKRVAADNSGNFYFALTRKSTGSERKATVAKYNSLLQSLWETELYNNPNFGASSLGITLDNTGYIYVSGKTELSVVSGTIDNTFAACLTIGGTISWKKYLEIANTGSAALIDENGKALILNSNCFVINVLDVVSGSPTGILRTFDACDSDKTDAFGKDFDINYDGNLIMAGSKGGGFYLVMKSPDSLQPL
jgi:hypothetical protein